MCVCGVVHWPSTHVDAGSAAGLVTAVRKAHEKLFNEAMNVRFAHHCRMQL